MQVAQTGILTETLMVPNGTIRLRLTGVLPESIHDIRSCFLKNVGLVKVYVKDRNGQWFRTSGLNRQTLQSLYDEADKHEETS